MSINNHYGWCTLVHGHFINGKNQVQLALTYKKPPVIKYN